ncbi:MAG TPA: fumarylacetoacetate hydrolase family protein [Rhizomicrobium sp.]|nr:fumarylacetoacetate hydrolase family protein [Rhizomicrobium sp.]
MEHQQEQAACELLFRHWSDGTQLDALPPDLRPVDRAEAYRVQACIEAFTDAPLYGWKIAATSIAGQRHIGVDGPLAGRILAERVIADGGSCPLGGNLMKVAELEFAFRMAVDLAPRATPYSQDEVLAAVASLHPAIELPDSRFADFVHAGLAQLVADNACAHRFVLGPATTADWRAMDLAAHPGKVFRNGVLAEEGLGRNVLDDPRIALTWLANELSRHGMTLKAGQVVTTGTCAKPLAIAAGDRVEGDLGILGRVSVTIT